MNSLLVEKAVPWRIAAAQAEVADIALANKASAAALRLATPTKRKQQVDYLQASQTKKRRTGKERCVPTQRLLKFNKALGDRVAQKDDVHLPEVWAKGKTAYKALKSVDPDYKVSADGEGSLLGGCFVFEAKTGIVGFMHCDRVLGDVADPQALLGALTKASL